MSLYGLGRDMAGGRNFEQRMRQWHVASFVPFGLLQEHVLLNRIPGIRDLTIDSFTAHRRAWLLRCREMVSRMVCRLLAKKNGLCLL